MENKNGDISDGGVMSGESRGGRNRKERPVRIEYVNMAGEQRTLETKERRRPDHPRRARTERKLFCVCGHEICLGCMKVTWRTKIAGESVRCCCCERDNSLHDLKLGPHVMTIDHPKWDLFVELLEEAVEEHGCDAETQRLAWTILHAMPGIDVEESLNWMESCAGFCDCEILLNVDPLAWEQRVD